MAAQAAAAAEERVRREAESAALLAEEIAGRESALADVKALELRSAAAAGDLRTVQQLLSWVSRSGLVQLAPVNMEGAVGAAARAAHVEVVLALLRGGAPEPPLQEGGWQGARQRELPAFVELFASERSKFEELQLLAGGAGEALSVAEAALEKAENERESLKEASVARNVRSVVCATPRS